MARRPDCHQEMATARRCTVRSVDLHGTSYKRARFGEEEPSRPLFEATTCGDCGARPGGFHHHGCDLEACPRCGGQLITCGCVQQATVLPLRPVPPTPRRPPLGPPVQEQVRQGCLIFIRAGQQEEERLSERREKTSDWWTLGGGRWSTAK